MPTKIGMKRTTPKKHIKKKLPKDWLLDDLVRQYIRKISGGYCKRCKRYVGLEHIEVAHMYKRKRKTVRWDLRNVYPLCTNDPRTGKKGCHQQVDDDPIKLTSFMYDVMSKEEIADLERIANMTIKEYPIDREAIKQNLKEQLKGVSDGREMA